MPLTTKPEWAFAHEQAPQKAGVAGAGQHDGRGPVAYDGEGQRPSGKETEAMLFQVSHSAARYTTLMIEC